LNEFDEHALEEALLLKEEHGGTVTVIAFEGDDTDKVLYTAIAKGADRAVKITNDLPPGTPNHVLAKALASVLSGMEYDLVLTGVQAADDRDGQLGVLLANYLDVPHVSVVSGVAPSNGAVTVQKEYAGGVMAEFEVDLPAVLGVQAASKKWKRATPKPKLAPAFAACSSRKKAPARKCWKDRPKKSPNRSSKFYRRKGLKNEPRRIRSCGTSSGRQSRRRR